jgi:tetratricopeptide (TPR) repeat protein
MTPTGSAEETAGPSRTADNGPAARATASKPHRADQADRADTRERPARRPTDLRLAHLHLRLGSPSLARAELEALAVRKALDADGLLDLAEARWRTGDLSAAGDAAQAYLSVGGEAALSYVIAAEAVAAVGRPAEARRLAARAVELLDDPLDRVFAGMPQSLVWPADAAEAGQHAGTLFEGVEAPPPPTAEAEAEPAARAPVMPSGPGLWDSHVDDAVQPSSLPDPADELDAGRGALASGDVDVAAIRLGLALRLAPALAPAIIDALGALGAAGSPAIDLVRGDAYRAVGHETDARLAYASAARAAGEATRRSGDGSGDASGDASPSDRQAGGSGGETRGLREAPEPPDPSEAPRDRDRAEEP